VIEKWKSLGYILGSVVRTVWTVDTALGLAHFLGSLNQKNIPAANFFCLWSLLGLLLEMMRIRIHQSYEILKGELRSKTNLDHLLLSPSF
jgi:hypothetical protein